MLEPLPGGWKCPMLTGVGSGRLVGGKGERGPMRPKRPFSPLLWVLLDAVHAISNAFEIKPPLHSIIPDYTCVKFLVRRRLQLKSEVRHLRGQLALSRHSVLPVLTIPYHTVL